MKSYNLNYVYSIRGLLIPRQAKAIDIDIAIDEYISLVPALSEKIADNLDNGRELAYAACMKTALSLLRCVYARWLETDAETILRAANRGHMDICKKFTPSFLRDILSLSIEMQMVQEKAAAKAEMKHHMVEIYSDIVHNVTAIGKLVAENEFRRACDMLTDISGFENEKDVDMLKSVLINCNKAEAEMLVKTLREKYLEKAVRAGGSKDNFKHTVLAVDDRPEILSLVGLMLRERHKVLCAPGGVVALKLLKEQTPDLFILDIDMPGMDGFVLAETIRCMDNHVKTPIIFLTSNANRDYVIRALKSGGSDFVVKPTNKATLLGKVAKFLP